MAHKILMPALSPTMRRGKIAKWNVNQGDQIEIGQVIAEIETDKAVMEFESSDFGIMGKIRFPEGSEVEVGTHIAWLLESKDEQIQDHEEKKQDLSTGIINGEPKVDQPSISPKKNLYSTPGARAKAAELGINIQDIHIDRRIKIKDIIDASKSSGRKGLESQNSTITSINNKNENLVNPSTMQKIIADRMCLSKNQVPHFYIETEIRIDELIKLKTSLNNKIKTTLTHWIILAVAEAVKQNPIMKNSWKEGQISINESIDISIAVEVSNGLVTPVIHKVDELSLTKLVQIFNKLVEKARSKSLNRSEYEGGIITISNMGSWGIKQVYPIINQPQGAIVGVGCSRDHVILVDGLVKSEKIISVTLSGDHRVLNGTDGASFLRSLKTSIENPLNVLL